MQETISEHDLVVAFCRINATHEGEAFGMPIAFEGTLLCRVRNSKAVEAWNSFDFLKMFQQMEVVRMADT